MPRIDPLKLLSCLKVLLAPNGGIRSANEVKRLAELMLKYSKKLVSKCIYIQILKCTNTDLLEKFMGAGGWGLTHIWLNDGIRTMNWPLVQEILELLLLCPVDVQRLRSNTAPKLVKALCKDGGNEGVRILATKLVEQWLKIVKGETMATASLTRNNSTIPTVPTDNNESVDHNATVAQTQTATCNTPNNLISASNALIVDSNHASNIATETNKDQDPLAISNNIGVSAGDESLSKKVNMNCSSPPNSSDSALVYKIVIKDGKQCLAKVEQNQLAPNQTAATGVDVKEKLDSDLKDNVENKSSSNEIQELKEKEKETDSKDIKDSKENDKEKRDRDRSRDHKSSSSHRKSSSSTSSSKSSSKSGSSSSLSSSSKSKHSSSSSSHRSSKDGSSSSSTSKSKDRDKERSSSDKDRKSSKSSSSSSSSKDKSKDRDRDRERDRHKSKDKDKDGKDKDKDNEKDKEDKEKEKAVQAEKDKDTLSKVLPPSIDKLGKIPRKPKEEEGSPNSNKSSPITTSITIPSKKASMSIEVRRDIENRPKTVKTYNSQFRSHGLAEEAPPPPSRKGLKKPISQSIPGTTIMSSITLKRSSPPPISASISSTSSSPPSSTGTTSSTIKDSQPQEKKIKIDLNPSTNSNEKPGAIKLIAPKPKPSTLVESDMFMDALSASAHLKKDTRKRKRRPSTSKDAGKDSSGNSSPPESPVSPGQKVTPLKFYQDTLEDKDEEKAHSVEDKAAENDDDKNEDEDDLPLKRVKEVIEEKREEEERLRRENEVVDESELNIKKPPGPGCGPDGPPGVLMLHRRKGPKKKLKWKAQEELEEIRYFELDETERVNVTKTFTDMKQMERFNEREAFIMARKLNNEDVMAEQTSWTPLILVDDVPPHPEGSQSKEKKIQSDREQTTLKALYFNRQMIPETPAEPDMEVYHITEPAVIPLDDVTGNPDAVNDFTSIPWPDPKGSPPPMGDPFLTDSDSAFPPASPFPPFMQFNSNSWPMEHGSGPPNGVMPPSLLGPLGNFNNMAPMNLNNMNNIHNMNNMVPPNMSQNMLMHSPPDDRGNMSLMNMNLMPGPFGGPAPFGPVPPNNSAGFNNMMGGFGLNNMNMGMSSNSNNRGSWRGGAGGGSTGSGGSWRPQGANNNSSRNWLQGSNSRICKQFQRGYCRNGIKCSYLHITPNRL